jgi:Ca2+-binding RTX toxin-like protein
LKHGWSRLDSAEAGFRQFATKEHPVRLRVLAFAVLVVLAAAVPAASGRQQSSGCLGKRPTIVGTDGNDALSGTANADVILGLGGDDTIDGGGGRDVVCAGDGNDTIQGGLGADELAGENGDDHVDGGPGLDYVVYEESPAGVTVDLAAKTATGWGTDTLANIEAIVGSRFNDVLRGEDGPNYLAALEGNDDLSAFGGNDYLDGGSGDDALKGGKGFDTVDFFFAPRGVSLSLASGRASGYGRDRLSNVEDVDGSRYADMLIGNASPNWLRGFGGDDSVLGVVGRDRLEGGRGDDRVFGGRGSDRLAGGPGRDFLNGGYGRDRLSGGGGRDRCRYGERLVGCP